MATEKLSAFTTKLAADRKKTYDELTDLSVSLNLDIIENRRGNLASYPAKLARLIEVMRAQDFALGHAKTAKSIEDLEKILDMHLMLSLRSTSPDGMHYKSHLGRIIEALREHR